MAKIGYGQSISWRGRDGTVTKISVDSHDNYTDAFRDAYESAVRLGYTPRRWWQVWRWAEPDYEKLAREHGVK